MITIFAIILERGMISICPRATGSNNNNNYYQRANPKPNYQSKDQPETARQSVAAIAKSQ